jgi:hypothetical protein
LILVSGKTKEFLFSPSDSAGDIAQIVFESWPEGKFKFYFKWILENHFWLIFNNTSNVLKNSVFYLKLSTEWM